MNTTTRRPASGPDYATLATSLAGEAKHPRDLDQRGPGEPLNQNVALQADDAPDEQPAPDSDGPELPEEYEDTAQDVNTAPATGLATTTIGERTATTLEAYSASTIANIRELRGRLDALETFFVEDAAQVKERISAHMANGQRVVAILAGVNDQIKELETRRDEMLRAHARGNR